MDVTVFNSRDRYFKSEFGAVAEGTCVRFRIVLPRSFMCNDAVLCIRRDDGDFEYNHMLWAGMSGEDCEIWEVEASPEEAGLYWYYFSIQSPWGQTSVYNDGNGVARFAEGEEEQKLWQLTVYSKDFKTPDWLKGGIMYQIFPDRFYNSGKKKTGVPADRILRNDYENLPYWRPDENGKVLNNDYFGGDFRGIEKKLDYLSGLGVNCIYLNPVFEAHSNHRYNTADYFKTDPLLGSEEDFRKLCDSAHKRGIRIILDGVFSHTGDDSVYFNKYRRYGDGGAYNTKKSPYYKWYDFWDYPDSYRSWWGFETLPEVNEENPSYIKFMTGRDGVIEKWLKAGIDGWRLDVADELPDVFIDAARKAVKRTKSDAVLLGEVWEDASNKISYGERRRFLLGRQFDNVMNYPFANAVIEFARFGIAEKFAQEIMAVVENYPAPAMNIMMNHIGTHDTERAITALVGESCEGRDREWQEKHNTLSKRAYKKGVALLKLASAVQFMLPGVPCIYYGDEIGMQGYKDPFNRAYFNWDNQNTELLEHYKKLGKIRKEHACLKEGTINFISSMLGCAAFERTDGGQSLLIIANRNEEDISYNLPERWQNTTEILLGKKVTYNVKVPAVSAVILAKG